MAKKNCKLCDDNLRLIGLFLVLLVMTQAGIACCNFFHVVIFVGMEWSLYNEA